ncbi:hypothetical protein LAZ67_22001036 [Cordylochernes scorpioides]|uniref:SPIN-DOC-like zinc-finger domain-containing protein n=1 Tax=Cordylochernes scorpioides TaxID=51811 RepID=A0ABY6LPQ6_9ARAC|nr:hypothetical protein LAZ67_22001036 [Cordylochernes scorpioides]
MEPNFSSSLRRTYLDRRHNRMVVQDQWEYTMNGVKQRVQVTKWGSGTIETKVVVPEKPKIDVPDSLLGCGIVLSVDVIDNYTYPKKEVLFYKKEAENIGRWRLNSTPISTVSMPRRKICAHYEHMSEFETGRAIGLKEVGWSNRLIARHLCRSDAAIRRCWQKNFQEKWELEYFCSEVKDKICLICNNAISVPKLYNIKRHYEQHKSKYDTYEHLMRQEKLKEFKLGMKKQQFMFTKVSQESEAAVHMQATFYRR